MLRSAVRRALAALGALALVASEAGAGCSEPAPPTAFGASAIACTRQSDCGSRACFASACGVTPTCQAITPLEQGVCACNGVTYPTSAAALGAGQFAYSVGPCEDGGTDAGTRKDGSLDAAADATDATDATTPYTVLQSGLGEVNALYVVLGVPGNIYYRTADAVYVAPGAGGAATRLASSAGRGPIAFDGLRVYWSEANGGVFSVPSTGGATTTLVPPGAAVTPGLAVDRLHAYFVGPTPQEISRVPVEGGAVEPVLTAECPSQIALEPNQTSGDLWFAQSCPSRRTLDVRLLREAPFTVVNNVGPTPDFTISGGLGYVAGAGLRRFFGRLYADPVTIVPATTTVRSVAVGGAWIYYTTGNEVHQVHLSPGFPDTLVARLPVAADIVVVDIDRVYFSAGTFIGSARRPL